MEKSKCCKECNLSINGQIDICEDLNCSCHTPQVTESEIHKDTSYGTEELREKLGLPTQTDEVEDWEKEFDKEFCSLYGIKIGILDGEDIIMGNPPVKKFKQFIRNLLSSNTERVKNKMIMELNDDKGYFRPEDDEQSRLFLEYLDKNIEFINNIK